MIDASSGEFVFYMNLFNKSKILLNLSFATLLIGILTFSITGFFDWYQTSLLYSFRNDLVWLLLLLMFINLIIGFRIWKNNKFYSFIPFWISLFLFLTINSSSLEILHNKIKLRRLERNLPQYNFLINQIESGQIKILNNPQLVVITSDFPATKIWATKSLKKGFYIQIFTGSVGFGSASRYWGYLYTSEEEINPIDAYLFDSFYLLQIKPHWYLFRL
jgi:hypothetical protein